MRKNRSMRTLLYLVLIFPLAVKAQEFDSNKIPGTVEIPQGKYLMGTPETEEGRNDNEGPEHIVILEYPLFVGKTEVTKEQYRYFIEATEYQPIDRCLTNENGWKVVEGLTWNNPGFQQEDSEPVICVNWNDAKAYVQWLSEITNETWRLPSESEWEYFARAGTSGKFSNNSNEDAICEIAYAANPTICPSLYKYLSPVGQLKPNNFGLHDVHGNVFEWVEDCYHSSYEGAPLNGQPWLTECEDIIQRGEVRDNLRILRGGSAFAPPNFVRSGLRSWSEEEMGHINVGFRVVKEYDQIR